MATIKQKKLAKALVENLNSSDPESLREILVSVGYEKSTAEKNANDLIKRAGVVEELAKLGFSIDKADETVGNIMNNAKERSDTRLRAADMVYKRLGGYAPEKTMNLGLEVKIEGEEALKYLELKKEFEQKAFHQITNE